MLERAGVEAFYSCEADNDDTVASHAQHDGAAILSEDKDMFRYTPRTYKVYSDFRVSDDGFLELTPHRLNTVTKGSLGGSIIPSNRNIIGKRLRLWLYFLSLLTS
jgi:hypothetical protein